jgi:hypothetical protein
VAPATPPSGKLAQGPVSGATIFADRIGGGTRFVWDIDEVKAPSDASGNYRLPTVPTYNYVLVSKGGTDTLTGLPAIQMLAPAGSINITPLTTLIALDSTNTLYLKLQKLQPTIAPLDFDISTSATPATLLLVKSVETAVQSISSAVIAGGFTISDQQLADIQFQAFQRIALGFAATTEKLETPAGLKIALTAGVSAAITAINAASNIEINPAAAASIADNAVTSASNLSTVFSASTMSVSSIQIENTLATPAVFASTFAAAFSASNPTYAAIVSFTTTSGNTPSPYGPADLVIAITPLPPGVLTGSVGTGGSGGGTGIGTKPVL